MLRFLCCSLCVTCRRDKPSMRDLPRAVLSARALLSGEQTLLGSIYTQRMAVQTLLGNSPGSPVASLAVLSCHATVVRGRIVWCFHLVLEKTVLGCITLALVALAKLGVNCSGERTWESCIPARL